jgi:site-specific DNA-methyltransferase (cytosine-N4-specific)
VSRKSDLASAQNFSPKEVDLREVVEFAHLHGGDRKAFEAAIQQRYYDPKRTTPPEQKPKLAYNVANGMEKYGIIEKDASLTAFGGELFELREDDRLLHDRLARHILLELGGGVLLDCVEDMRAAGEPLTLINIRKALLDRGVYTASANKTISLMRLWLDEAGVTTRAWAIDGDRYRELLGLAEDELEALANRTPEERAVLKVLAEVGTTVNSSELRVAAEAAYGVTLNEKTFPKILRPLVEAGFLEFKAAGGSSSPVKPTERLLRDVTIPLIEQYGQGLPPRLRELLRRPLSEIVDELDDPSTHVKGLALEALAFKIMRSIGLNYRGTRYRPTSGGRFEVDLLFDSTRLAYSRWQIQCKNTTAVGLDDVAKEVGLVYRLLSNVIVVITRGRIGAEARTYAVDVMQKTGLAIILIDRDDVGRIVKDPLAIYRVLEREAAFAMSVKPLEALP